MELVAIEDMVRSSDLVGFRRALAKVDAARSIERGDPTQTAAPRVTREDNIRRWPQCPSCGSGDCFGMECISGAKP